ncbi:MAG: OpgC domain-containing protein [Ilumatobacteraceae bacterium]
MDRLRGLAIVSMVIAHMAGGSFVDKITHVPLWIDAAFLFVALAGLVVGIMQRRSRDAAGGPRYSSIWKKAVQLYLIQLVILVIALAVRSVASRPAELPSPEGRGGWVPALGQAATLQLPAQNLDVLPMYVVLFCWALFAIFLLHRGWARWLLVISVALNALGFAFTDRTVLPVLAADDGQEFNWLAWQLPFTILLVVGWNWREHDIRDVVLRRRTLVATAAIWLIAFGAAQVVGRTNMLAGTRSADVLSRLFGKFEPGPGTIVFGIATLVLGYAALVRWAEVAWLRPGLLYLGTIGRRSLDSFVILCLAVILFRVPAPYATSGPRGMAAAAVVLALCGAWAGARRAWTRRRTHPGPLTTPS